MTTSENTPIQLNVNAETITLMILGFILVGGYFIKPTGMKSEDALRGLVAAICKILVQEQEAWVSGLGTFRVVEQPSRLVTRQDGKTIIEPPIRSVTFSSPSTDSP